MNSDVKRTQNLREISADARSESFFDGHAWIGYRTYVRLVREASDTHRPRPIRGPGDVYAAFSSLSECDRERFYAIHLDARNQVCGLELVTQGILDCSLITPRELYKAAILGNAAGVILIHNHPSGHPEPSPEDRSVTDTLKRGGDILGIALLDHIIIGDGRFYSFADERLL